MPIAHKTITVYKAINIDVDVDLSDFLEAFADEDILEICKDRGLEVRSTITRPTDSMREAKDDAQYQVDSWLHDLRIAFLSRDSSHFEVLIARAEKTFGPAYVKQCALALPEDTTSTLSAT